MWILYLCTGFTSELCMEVQYSLGNLAWGHHNSGIPDSPWHRTDSFPASSHVTGNKTNYVLAILIQVQFTFYNCMPCYLLCVALRQRAHFWLLPSWCHTSRSVLYHTALIYTWHLKLTFSFHCSQHPIFDRLQYAKTTDKHWMVGRPGNEAKEWLHYEDNWLLVWMNLREHKSSLFGTFWVIFSCLFSV